MNKIKFAIAIISLIGMFLIIIFHNHFPFLFIGIFFGILAILNCIRFCRNEHHNQYNLYVENDSDNPYRI